MTSQSEPANVECLLFLERFHLKDGGVVRAVLDLAASLAKIGLAVVVATFDDADIPVDWERVGNVSELPAALAGRLPAVFVPRGVNTSRRRQSAEVYGQLRAFVATAAVIHLHVIWANSTAQLVYLAESARRPVVITPHGMLDDWSMSQGWLKKRIYYLLILRRLLKKCSRIHCTAEAEREQAEKWLAGTPVAVIPYVVDVSPFTEAGRTGDESNIPHILFLSRIHPKKSPHLLVEAAAILARRGQEIRLTIAGPVDDRAYAAKMKLCAEAANITSQVAFPGLVTGKDKVAIYGSADLFVLPTQQENFGIVLVEALASGTPVLTTRGTDIWKELQAAGAEIVSDRADDVAEAIARLVGNRERLRELGQQGRTWAQEVFGGDTIARRFSSLYRDVAKACESI